MPTHTVRACFVFYISRPNLSTAQRLYLNEVTSHQAEMLLFSHHDLVVCLCVDGVDLTVSVLQSTTMWYLKDFRKYQRDSYTPKVSWLYMIVDGMCVVCQICISFTQCAKVWSHSFRLYLKFVRLCWQGSSFLPGLQEIFIASAWQWEKAESVEEKAIRSGRVGNIYIKCSV